MGRERDESGIKEKAIAYPELLSFITVESLLPEFFHFQFIFFFLNSNYPSGHLPPTCLCCVYPIPLSLLSLCLFVFFFVNSTHLFPTLSLLFLSFLTLCSHIVPLFFFLSSSLIFLLFPSHFPSSPRHSSLCNLLYLYYTSISSPLSPPFSCMIWAPRPTRSPALQAA